MMSGQFVALRQRSPNTLAACEAEKVGPGLWVWLKCVQLPLGAFVEAVGVIMDGHGVAKCSPGRGYIRLS
jgi:hypothetical protein